MSLIDDALVIKNETGTGLNTANRVGGWMESTLESVYLIGFMDYNHAGSTQSYTSGTLVLENDGLGTYTNKTYKPEGVIEIYNTTTNQFDFTQLSLGDTVDIRLDLNVDLNVNNQVLDVNLRLGTGAGEYLIPFVSDKYYKTSGNKRVVEFNGIYMGDTNTLDNPAQIELSSTGSATVTVNGWYVRILKKSKVSA